MDTLQYNYTICSLFLVIIFQYHIICSTGAIVSLSQSQYSVAENDSPLAGTITLSSRTSKDVIVEVIISNESANGSVE